MEVPQKVKNRERETKQNKTKKPPPQPSYVINKITFFKKKNLKIELPYDPTIALLGIYPKDTGVLIQRST